MGLHHVKGWVAASLRTSLHLCAAWMWPPVCVLCKQAVQDHDALCVACWSDLTLITDPVCPRLGVPLPYGSMKGVVSGAALARPPQFNRARGAALYRGSGRTLVRHLKYGDRLDLLPLMGRLLLQAGAELLTSDAVLVPVPMPLSRHLRRGHNQAEGLARWVADVKGLPCEPSWLKRTRHTKPQFGLTRAQRADNMQGAFTVPAAAAFFVKGRHVVLVDDVMTTGATLNAATHALLRAGACSVDALVFSIREETLI